MAFAKICGFHQNPQFLWKCAVFTKICIYVITDGLWKPDQLLTYGLERSQLVDNNFLVSHNTQMILS